MIVSDAADMEKLKKKELAEDVLREFIIDSAFMHHDGVAITFAKCNNRLTEERVSWLFSTGEIPVSDVFIVYAVYLLGFATAEMVFKKLKIMKNENPEKIIPSMDASGVRMRLKKCCGKGLLICQSFQDEMVKTKFDLYFVSHNGFILARKVLGCHIYSDDMLGAMAPIDKLSRAAVMYVALSVYENVPGCISMSAAETDNTFKETASFTPFMFAKIKRRLETGMHQYYVFEPMYFQFDEKVDNKAVRIERYRTRLKMLMQWVNMANSTEKAEVQIIVVCENLEGVKYAYDLIETTSPLLNVCYTSERVMHIFSSKALSKLSTEGFVSAKKRGDKLKLSPISLLH